MIYFKSNSRRKCAIELMHLRLDDCFVLSTKGESDWMAPKLWGGVCLLKVENLFYMFLITYARRVISRAVVFNPRQKDLLFRSSLFTKLCQDFWYNAPAGLRVIPSAYI
jgi:hypothetical protein